MPEEGDDAVAALNIIDEVSDEVPGLPGAEAHVGVQGAVHDRERDLNDPDLLLFIWVIGPERIAHPIPEPGAVGIPEGGVIREPCFAEVFPGLRHPEPEEVVPVTGDRLVGGLLKPSLFFLQFLCVGIGPVPTVEADLPPPISDHTDLGGEIFHVVGVVLVVILKGEEEEGGGGAVLLLKGEDLLEVAEGRFWALQAPGDLSQAFAVTLR